MNNQPVSKKIMKPILAIRAAITAVLAVAASTFKDFVNGLRMLDFRPANGFRPGAAHPSTLTPRNHTRKTQDAALLVETALPAAASTTVNGAKIDTNAQSFREGDEYEILLELPALTTTQLPNAATLTGTIMASAASDGSSPDTLATVVLTGAGGVGAAANSVRVRVQRDTKRYIFGRTVSSGTYTDSSSKKSTISLNF